MVGDQDTSQGDSQRLAVIFQQRFVVLLGAVILLFISSAIVPLVAPGAPPRLTGSIMAGLFVAIVLAAVFAASKSRVTTIIAASLAAPTIVLRALNLVSEQTPILIISDISGILFLGYVITLFLGILFQRDRVTFDTVCVSLCIYLLLGVMWAVVYSLLETLQPGSFRFALGEGSGLGSMRFGSEYTGLALYYSFGAMTTLGANDVVPASASARMFSTVEAISGQLYLAVLVARMVGLHIAHSITRKRGAS